MASEGALKAGKNIWAWQKRLREMPSVYWTESLGEPTGNYYLTREAAQLEVDYNDDHKDKYLFPKVTIRSASLHNMELSQERWTGVTPSAPVPSPGVTNFGPHDFGKEDGWMHDTFYWEGARAPEFTESERQKEERDGK